MKDKIGLTIIYKGKQVSKVLRYGWKLCFTVLKSCHINTAPKTVHPLGELYNNSTCN